ncbi:COX15/CtaA family protein [Propionibacteriaceae bacterium Y2011]|uniref:COX15/CtaA family protein n=1 Tax=Microlunatus sp. Y2014 TaxID=3418488 RepID=UPI003B4ECBF2
MTTRTDPAPGSARPNLAVRVWRKLLDSLPISAPRAALYWGIASLVANVLIIFTGGVVRLTGSGLGCPTWPRCTPESLVPHPELGIHGAIEFGNRLMTFVLAFVAVGTALAAFRVRRDGLPRRDLRLLSLIMGFGIPLQAVIGGITVLTGLNPYVVAPHLMLSMALVGLSTVYVRLAVHRPRNGTGRWGRRLAWLLFAVMWVVVWLGTIVTGSGPHSGDESSFRTGFDPYIVSRIHATSVQVVVGLTLVALLVLRNRAVVTLLAVEVAQGVIGYVQYFTGLPEPLVAAHLVGSALAVAAVTWVVVETYPSASADPHEPATGTGAAPLLVPGRGPSDPPSVGDPSSAD